MFKFQDNIGVVANFKMGMKKFVIYLNKEWEKLRVENLIVFSRNGNNIMFLPNEEHFCHQIPVLYLDLAKEIYRVTFFFSWSYYQQA